MFLLISTVLWFLIKLSHSYTATLSYPVRYINPPEGKVIIGTPPRQVQVQVHALGFTLLKYKLMSLYRPININLAKALPLAGTNTTRYSISTSTQYTELTAQIPGEVSVVDINPKELIVEMGRVVAREVPVVPAVSLSFAPQYMLSGQVTVNPKVVRVTGPKAIVDTIRSVLTQPVTYSLLEESLERKIGFKPVSQVQISPSSVKVTVPVARFTEAIVPVSVSIDSLPPGADLILLPSTVKVKCNVILSKYSAVNPKQFEARVNYSEVIASKNGRARVFLTRYPHFVSIVDYEPLYIDVIINRRK